MLQFNGNMFRSPLRPSSGQLVHRLDYTHTKWATSNKTNTVTYHSAKADTTRKDMSHSDTYRIHGSKFSDSRHWVTAQEEQLRTRSESRNPKAFKPDK